ncbi:hypothetical protein, conserved [Leishmania lindenbergi]|uniref:Separase n=1 Tax=Leishmania lindenbergi TaxID=651832 RepID=A0AAW3AUJ7_9TRYP
MARHLIDQLTRLAQSGEWSLCLDLLRRAVTGNHNALWSTAATRLVLSEPPLLLKWASQPCADQTRQATAVLLLLCNGAQHALSIAATKPSQFPQTSAGAGNHPPSPVDASAFKPSAREWKSLVTHRLKKCTPSNSIDRGHAPQAPPPLSSSTVQPGVHRTDAQSSDSVATAITELCACAHWCGIAVDESLVEKARGQAAAAKQHWGEGVRRIDARTRGASEGHALRLLRTGLHTLALSQSATRVTGGNSTRAAASKSFSFSVVYEDERRASRDYTPSSSAVPSSSPRKPRVTRRLAAAWQRACSEACPPAHMEPLTSRARGSSRWTRSFTAEEELRAHFQRALCWRSGTSAQAMVDGKLVTEVELRLMSAFVVESYVSLRGKLESHCRQGASIVRTMRNLSIASELQWQLLVLLVLADEVCATLGGSNSDSLGTSRKVGGVTESIAARECIVAVAAVQLCALSHMRSQRSVTVVTRTDTEHSEMNAREATAVAPYSVHTVRAARRLVESLLALNPKVDEGAVLSPTSADASSAWSPDNWLGEHLRYLAEAGCLSSSARRHKDQGAATSAPLLLLLRLLVQSTSWHSHCAGAAVKGAQYLRHVCAAVLLIESVLQRASEDELPRRLGELRGALQLSQPLVCEDKQVEEAVRKPSQVPRQGARHHSRSSHEGDCADSGTVALSAATGCFVCQVLDGCPPWISRRLLLSGSPPHLLRSGPGNPEKLLDQELLLAEVMIRLSPGMVLNAAWRQRHTRDVEAVLCTSPVGSATELEYADASDVRAGGGANSTALKTGDSDARIPRLLLQQHNELVQVCSRLYASTGSCPYSVFTTITSLPPSWHTLSSPFLSSILSQLDPPAIFRIAEVLLETLMLRPSLSSAVRHEGYSRAHRSAHAARLRAEVKEGGLARADAGVTQAQAAVLALQCLLMSVPTDDARAEVSQRVLTRFCAALMESARAGEGGNADLTREMVHGAGVCLVALLVCASTSRCNLTAATQDLLAAVKSLVDSRRNPLHGKREGDEVYGALHSWWLEGMGSIVLALHAQFARGASQCARSASTEHSTGEAPHRSPLVSLSPAAQLAAWWESQPSLQTASDALQPRLREVCYWTGTRIMRLCNTAAYVATTSTPTPNAASSPLSLQTLSTTDAEAVRLACTAAYEMLSLEQLCHLALASGTFPVPEEVQEASNAAARPSSSTASSLPSTPAVYNSCVRLLATAEAGGLLEGDLGSDDGVTSIFTHPLTVAREPGDGALNVLQHHQGHLLTDRQHESLVEALRDCSRRRCVKEAVALFYAHERQHRRLQLAEVELFAETAKRAPLSFLVRLLLYLPPPCESAVLASAIITGAWKAYQRALHQHSNRVAAAAPGAKRGGNQHEESSLASSIRRRLRRRVEQAWYESLAVARRALALLPSAGAADDIDEAEQLKLHFILQRLVCARPRSMQPSASPRPAHPSSSGVAVFLEEWDSCTVQSAQLLAALLRSSSSLERSRQRHHVLQGASVRHSVGELCQIIQFCDANGDSTTAVQEYLRLANSPASHPAHSHPSSASARKTPKLRNSPAGANYARAVPLLSVDVYVSLLSLARMHVVAACEDDAATYAVPVAAASSKSVPPATRVAYVAAHQETSEEVATEAPVVSGEAPHSGAALMRDLGEGGVGGADAEMTLLRHLPASLAESAAPLSDAVAEAATESAGLRGKSVQGAVPGDSRYHANGEDTPASAATAAATRRTITYAVNCTAALQRLSLTLPRPLLRILRADSALTPLTAILHDALRWCRLRPRSMPARDSAAAAAADGLNAAALNSAADFAVSDGPATVDVVARLIAAMFQLDGAEVDEMVDVAHLHPSTATAAVAVTRRTFACRVPPVNLEFWRLVRHSDALLSYIWDYVWELYQLEVTVLWVSPAQQQRAYLAVAECAQVIVAALQALDVWALKMRTHEVRERGSRWGSGGDGDYQVNMQPSLTTARSDVPAATSSERRLCGSVDEWRARLRSGALHRLHARLFDEGNPLAVPRSFYGEAAPTLIPDSLASSDMVNTTSAAIEYVTAVIQHSSRAFKSCAPADPLMQLAANPIAAAFSAPLDKSRNRSVISPGGVPELLSVTTQQYYGALSRLVSTSLPAIDGGGPLLPAHLSSLATNTLSYILRCVTDTATAVTPRHPNTIGITAESETGSTTALLVRVAAAEGMLRHIASLVQHALVLVEEADAAPHTATADLLRTLWCLSGEFEYCAGLLDECMSWWTLLDLEDAVAASPSSELLEANDTSGGDFGGVISSVSKSLMTRSALTHIRVQLKQLTASFVDLYASGWCGGLHARLPEVTRARMWSRDKSRTQHLYVCAVLHHFGGASGDAAISARLAGAAEVLQEALTRHSSSYSATSRAAMNAQGQQQSGYIDLDALVNNKGEDTTEAAHCTAATGGMQALERTLLAYLTLKKQADGVVACTPDQVALVSIAALVGCFQRAVAACPSLSQAALLWRLFPALLDNVCDTTGTPEETPRGDCHAVPRPMWCESDAAAGRSLRGVTCSVPTALWRQLLRMCEESDSEATSDTVRASGVRAEALVMHSERLAVYAALLSRNPLVIMDVVMHPLLRHHQLAETHQEQWQQVQVGAGGTSASCASQGPSCEWLKKMLLYSAVNNTVAEARPVASSEAGEFTLPAAWTAAGNTLGRDDSGRVLRTSSPGSLALLSSQPLLEQFVSTLILAVLRDASLICEGQTCALITSGSKQDDEVITPTLSPLQCSSFVSSSAVAIAVAERRESMLVELVQHLAYITPHALHTVFRWITGTPYPSAAHAQRSAAFPEEATPQAKLKCKALSCVDATTLRRLRVAMLSCGPWPASVARKLLQYAMRAQGVAADGSAAQAHRGDFQTAAILFPEALDLYQGLQQQRESERNHAAAVSRALTATAQCPVDTAEGVRRPLLLRVLQHYGDQVEGSSQHEQEDGSGAADSRCQGALYPSPMSSSPADALSVLRSREHRFVVGSSSLLLPAPAAPSFSVVSTSYADCIAADVPLSAIQLACEEGARLVKASCPSTARAAEAAAAARIAQCMRDLATAPSHAACIRLLSDGALATDVIAMPSESVVDAVMFAWRTLLLRSAELDCCEQDRSGAGSGAGVITAEVHRPTRNLQRPRSCSRDRHRRTVLDVYAMFFLLASRVCDRLATTTPLAARPKAGRRVLSGQRRLNALKREVTAYWAAVWADEVMTLESVVNCSTAREAEAIGARIDEYCHSGADGVAMYSPTLGHVTLKEHLCRAQTRLQRALQESSASCSSLRATHPPEAADGKAAAELLHLLKEASAHLRDAGARLTSLPRRIPAEANLRAAQERTWSLWPPAASDTHRLRAAMRESSRKTACVTVTVRNPVSVVAYLRAWQREHSSPPRSGRPDTRAERRPESVRATALSEYDVSGAACILLPAICLQSSSPAAQGGKQPATPKRGAQWVSPRTSASLMDVWRVADVFVRCGHLVLTCMPRDGSREASDCDPARGSSDDSDETDPFQGEVESTAPEASTAGAGVVMQALLDLVSLEDARLQKEQQQGWRRQRAGLPSYSTPSDDMLQLLAVLRQLRQRLLPPAAAATVSGAHGTGVPFTTGSAPWASFMPLSYSYVLSTSPTSRSGDLGATDMDPPSLALSRDAIAWHSYLHVLHLCGSGLLDRVVQGRGRRASPSAATLTHVAHQLQRLVSLSRLEEQAAQPTVSSALRAGLLNTRDAQRIICFQLRGLQRIRDYANTLGWTVAQQITLQHAQQSIMATVTAVCALQRRAHHGQERLQEAGACSVTATGPCSLSAGVQGRVTAEVNRPHINHVEQATAECFYPALARSLRLISAAHPPSAAADASAQEAVLSRLRSRVEDRIQRAHDDVTEVVTEFAAATGAARRGHPSAFSRASEKTATTATAESDKAAATLLATVHSAFCESGKLQSGSTHRQQNGETAHTFTKPTVTPVCSCRELHALLSAVVAAVQRRSRNPDPQLLLDFLSGSEREVLGPLAAAAEDSYLERLMKTVALAASASSPKESRHRIVEAGLTLCTLLRPWLPLSTSARETCAMEATLCLVTLALQQHARLSEKGGARTAVRPSSVPLHHLVHAVLVDVLHHQQSVRLSGRGIALLGIIYNQLRLLEGAKGGVHRLVRDRRNSHTVPRADSSLLLWRILSALSTLSEKDAAEVRDAWMAECEAGVSAGESSMAEHEPARVLDMDVPTSFADKGRLRTENGNASTAMRNGAHVIEVLYRGALQVLGEGGSGHGATEESGRWKSPLLLAATRLRAWLASEEVPAGCRGSITAHRSDSAAAGATLHASMASTPVLPQLCVLVEALCSMLVGVGERPSAARSSRGEDGGSTSGGKRGTLAIRRDWLACLRVYSLYAALKRTCSAPLWKGPQRCLQKHVQNSDGGSPRHDNGRSCRDCSSANVGDVAALVLELTTVAALSAAEVAPHLRRSGAVSDARQLALLSSFVRCCDSLGTPLPSLPSPPGLQQWRRERASATPVMTQVAAPGGTVLGCVDVDAHEAVRHLAARLLSGADVPPSAPSTETLFHDWRAVLTPLQALRRVTSAFAAPETSGHEGGGGGGATTHGSVWLFSTSSAGLQWARKCRGNLSSTTSATCLEAPSSDADNGDCEATQHNGHQLPQSQSCHCHYDRLLQGIFYATLRLLWRTEHLSKLPPQVLLKELLHPLAELERAAAATLTSLCTETEMPQRAAQSTAHDNDDMSAEVLRKIFNRLAVLTHVAHRLSTHPMLRASAADAGARGGGGGTGAGWTTALIVFKLLTQIEEALYTQCGRPQGDSRGAESTARTNAAFASPSQVFAARYADVLAQRGTGVSDYLSFLLIVSCHFHQLPPAHEDAAPKEPEFDEERRRLLRHAQLRHAVALAAPPPAVGAVMELFQPTPMAQRLSATAADPRLSISIAAGSTTTLSSNINKQLPDASSVESPSGEVGGLLQVLTPNEAALLQRLHHLLQATLPLRCRGIK